MNTERKMVPETGTPTESKIRKVDFGAADNDEMEIDLLDLAYTLMGKLHNIILCFLAGALLFNAYAYFCIAPTYQSTSKLYVVSASDDSVVNLSDLNIGTSLTADYEELILSYPLLDQVIDKLELEMTSEQLASMITLVNPDNTRVLSITVTSTDPQLSMDIANTLADKACVYLPDTMSTLAPNVAQEARLAAGKSAPSYLKYTMMGALLGALLYCGFVIAGYLMDDTIHTAEDMEKYFGIVPLTTIPDSDIFEEEISSRKHRGGKSRK